MTSTRARVAVVLLVPVVAAGLAPAAHAQPGPPSQPTSSTSSSKTDKAPGEFVELGDVAPSILRDIRYTTRHTFVGDRIDGYRAPLCLLTEDTARALRTAQRSLLRHGYTLKVYDCYRPQRAVDHFVEWAKDLDDQRMKREFYPRVEKNTLFDDGYIAEKSGHSRGSTVDLTVVELPAEPTRPYRPGEELEPCYAPEERRFPDNSLDMGTGYDCFDTLSRTLDPRITGEQRANRLLLKRALEKVGFVNYAAEWWHYTFQPETFPQTYFDFPVSRGALRGR